MLRTCVCSKLESCIFFLWCCSLLTSALSSEREANRFPVVFVGNYTLYENRLHGEDTAAALLSPWFGSSGPQCTLNFSLSMDGVNAGELSVLVATGAGEKHRTEMGSSHGSTGSK